MMRHIIWACAAVIAITALSYYTAVYNMEEAKQQAFMMKACVDAGGQWKRNFTPTWDCIRPEKSP